MIKWYKMFADVPDVGYTASAEVDHSRLSGYGSVPKLSRYEFDGKLHESLDWPTPQGITSASPVSRWVTEPLPNESPARTAVRQIREALELPGQLSDYHFAIFGCYEALWRNRREAPWVIQEIERLCWLDIRLIEAHPDTVSFEREGSTSFYHVVAFERLIYLYKREGYLREALEVAKRAAKFDQQQAALEELQQRIAVLESEDANSSTSV